MGYTYNNMRLIVLTSVIAAVIFAVAYVLRPQADPVPQAPKEISAQKLAALFKVQFPGTSQRTKAAGISDEPKPKVPQRHYHVAVRLIVNDTAITPINLGLNQRGIPLSIHSHDDTPTVHLHTPLPGGKLSLRQIWVAWGIQVNKGQVGPIKLTKGWKARMWDNGRPLPLDADPILKDREVYTISLAGPGFDLLKNGLGYSFPTLKDPKANPARSQ